MNTTDLIIAGLTVFGALEISYVESFILSHSGAGTNPGKSLRKIYWYDLTGRNRLIYWTGFICMLSPFILSLLKGLTS
jgi:hypothetical protein